MENCPQCGKAMSDGFLGAQTRQAGIRWFRGFAGPNFFGVRGDRIGETDGASMSWVNASRCFSCRLIVAHY